MMRVSNKSIFVNLIVFKYYIYTTRRSQAGNDAFKKV